VASAVIRSARVEDAEALAELGRQTYIETFAEGFGIPYPADDLKNYLDASWDLGRQRERLLDPTQTWWVAEQDGSIVGYATAGSTTLPHPEARPTHAELRHLYIARRAQGLGIGTRLLEIALEWMEAHTDGPLWIGVWSGNLKAQKLYAAYGFHKVGEYKYPVGTWFDDELILRR
jgi:ribosomal protein S18 acetylase RimI-like enzyme